MKRGLLRAGDAVPGAVRAPALRFARQRRRWMRFLGDGPRTLVHHDVHPGNFFWRSGRPGLLDWHLVRVGEGVGDVAYFLANALRPEIRREHEEGLLDRYRAGLLGAGVAAPAPHVLAQRYRAHLVYPFEAMVVTLAVGGMMDLAANLELVRRTGVAVADHEAFAAGPDRTHSSIRASHGTPRMRSLERE
jgi:aminoglycoside phosphotransferase (APT) family kinase protein